MNCCANCKHWTPNYRDNDSTTGHCGKPLPIWVTPVVDKPITRFDDGNACPTFAAAEVAPKLRSMDEIPPSDADDQSVSVDLVIRFDDGDEFDGWRSLRSGWFVFHGGPHTLADFEKVNDRKAVGWYLPNSEPSEKAG